MSWRDNISPSIKNHLEIQIKESSKYKQVYLKSKNPSNAQLWVAIANLSKQIFDLNLKIKFLEGVFKETLQKQKESPKKSKNLPKKKSSLKKTLKKY